MLFLLAGIILALLLKLWHTKRSKKFNVFKDAGIPGPEPNFFFGNFREIQKYTNVKILGQWTKQYGKIFGYFMGSHAFLVVTDTDICKQILIKDFHNFVNRAIILPGGVSGSARFTQHVASARGDKWKEHRALISPAFTSGKMKRMVPLINSAIDVLASKLEQKSLENSELEIYAMLKAMTLDVIGKTAFGFDTDVQRNPNDPFLIGVKEFVNEKFHNFSSALICFPEFANILLPVYNFIQMLFPSDRRTKLKVFFESCCHVVKARKTNPNLRRDDLLQSLIDAEMSQQDIKNTAAAKLMATLDESQNAKLSDSEMKPKSTPANKKATRHLNDNEVVSNTSGLLFAGFETTSTALAYLIHNLVNHPEVQEKLRAEIIRVLAEEGSLDYAAVSRFKYMDQVIFESLRKYPPVTTFITREAAEEIQYGDLTVPKGVFVQIPTTILHYDQDEWEEPEKFDPERWSPERRSSVNPIAFQGFGGGPRNCVGMRFAQFEMKLALGRILRDYRLVPSENTEMGDISVSCKGALMTPKLGVFLKAEKINQDAK